MRNLSPRSPRYRVARGSGARSRPLWVVTAIALLMVLALFSWKGTELGASDAAEDTTATTVLISLEDIQPPPPLPETLELFTLENHYMHPDNLFQPYFGGSIPGVTTTPHVRGMLHPLQDLLEMYVVRQGHDNNFSIRLLDNRTNELLELFELTEERLVFEETGEVTWEKVDQKRREHTTRLLDKYEDKGIPREALTVRWGRANQMIESRERKAPVMEYELRLAEYLGLSLLVTELGTVETFNNDRLVSPVGARGRYQMMPYQLRAHGINQYILRSAGGADIRVYEEWHPLLTMEPAFLMVRSHVNAVGNEIAGISAYHTGPGNIFRLLRMFLATNADALIYPHTVLDAYMWGLTTGFDTVSSNTSFRTYSRGYVPSAYGALRATQHIPVDTSSTLRAERVQLAEGERIYLSELLNAVAPSEEWTWATTESADTLTLYQHFMELNPHFVLPEHDGSGVPPRGNVRLVSSVQGEPVRFFLPLGATEQLAARGVSVLDETKTFRFDENTYQTPPRHAYTFWDAQYDQLLRRIERFGFTPENKKQLDMLVDQFELLAGVDPSHFRTTQLHIIRQHHRLWQFNEWKKLADATGVAKDNLRIAPQPPKPTDILSPQPGGVLLPGNDR